MPRKFILKQKKSTDYIKAPTPTDPLDVDLKATIHYATKLHATNCNKAVTKLKQSCNTLVTTMLQFVVCKALLHSGWWP